MSERDQYDIMHEFGDLVRSVYPNPPFLEPDLNDTTLVIVATSLIDKFLEMVLVAGFQKDGVSKRRLAQVFEGQGPLATFSAKISLCNLLGLTTDEVRHDLTLLRKIRNAFAHSQSELSLRDFPSALALKAYSRRKIEDASAERLKLKQSCMGIIGQLSVATLLRTAQHRYLAKNPDDVKSEYEIMLKETGAETDTSELPVPA